MNIHWSSELFLWPWPQQSNSLFSQDNPPYDNVPLNQVYLQKDQQSYLDYIILNFDLDLEDSKSIFLARQCGS